MDQEIQPRVRCDKWNTMYCTMYCALAYKSLLPLPSSMVVFLYAFFLKEWETHQHFSLYYWWFNPHYNEKKHSSLTAHLFIVICQSLKRLKKNTSSSYHQPVVSDAVARHCCQWEIPDVGDGGSFSALTNHVNRVESLIAGQRCMCLGTGTLCKLVFALSQWSGANSVSDFKPSGSFGCNSNYLFPIWNDIPLSLFLHCVVSVGSSCIKTGITIGI